MAYSNINEDKEQVGISNSIKSVGIMAFTIVIIYSSISNIWQQWQTLKEARERNLKLEHEVNNVTIQNKTLERQIEYATGSAYTQRKSREFLGLGGPNDFWLKLPNNEPVFVPEIKAAEVVDVPTIVKWWNLFTM